ncbi:hypothetical protein ANN_12581 [Periplaneta americana]|uniref:Uncharacterized protein n=1 Tax=Periplaneta americana TaxID=6978 RepID=A0ABQ8TJ77_PERAM|nr:hypothetical protein ANN_12581 [Periplaneta americana]
MDVWLWYVGICIQFPNQTNSDNTEPGPSINRGCTHLLKDSSPLSFHLKRHIFLIDQTYMDVWLWYVGICIQFPNQTNSDNTEPGPSINRGCTHLLKDSSPLSFHLKRHIFLIDQTYMDVWLWGSASNSQIRRIQTIQNRVLRLIMDAPWYICSDNLHTDLNVPTVESTLRSSYIRLHRSLVNHQNDLLNTIPEKLPPPRQIRRLNRKRHSDLLFED